jgi:hypothetical protein
MKTPQITAKSRYHEQSIQHFEMLEKSGRSVSPCVEVNGHMLADVNGDEVEAYPPEAGVLHLESRRLRWFRPLSWFGTLQRGSPDTSAGTCCTPDTNFCRHADPDPEDILEFYPSAAAANYWNASEKYYELAKEDFFELAALRG